MSPTLLALLISTAGAGECGAPCDGELACIRARTECLMERGENKAAVKELKAAYAAHPDEGELVQRMALAYQADGNTVWATRRLLEHVESHPDDTETRTWATWVLIGQGDLGRAEQLLPEAAAARGAPLQVRSALHAITLLQLSGEDELATELLRAVRKGGSGLWPEDAALERQLRAGLLGDHGDALSARLWLTAGWSTNATETSPQSEGGEGSVGSVLTSVDLVARHEPWTSPLARPRSEVWIKGRAPLAAPAFSWADLGTRLGLEVGRPQGVRSRLYYNFELFGDNTGDAHSIADARLFMEAHRGDLEVDLSPHVQLFGGGGRRIYRRLDRTRTEVDGGVALMQGFDGGWDLTALLTGRSQRARHPDWNLIGGTVLVRMVAPLPADGMFKVRAMVMRDAFGDHSLSRRDWTLRTQAGPWSPPVQGWRLGLTWSFNERWSSGDWTASADPYSYSVPDHRVLLEARWSGARDPTTHLVEPPPYHVTLPSGGGEQGDSGLDRVQDLLRQEDSARRGSSCVD